MSKTKEELNKLKEEVEAVNEKLQELTPEEIAQVSGGATNPHKKDLGSIAMSYGYVYVASASDNIKPDETASIDVLKDAASAAIYGSSARN